MHLTNAICNAQFSVTQITVAHFTVSDLTDPTKKWLPNLPLPNVPVAQFTVAHLTIYLCIVLTMLLKDVCLAYCLSHAGILSKH